MLSKILFLFIVTLELSASHLIYKNYYVPTNEIKLSTIVGKTKNVATLYVITKGRYTRRVKTKDLIALLKRHGYKDYTSKSRLIKFTKQSPVDTTKIQKSIQEHYENKYENITIKSIKVSPRGYLEVIPQEYSVKIQKKNHLKSEGTISIQSSNKKQFFFDYKIDASVEIFKARKNIKRNTELTPINTVKKSIILDKFRAMPIQVVKKATLQSKHNIKKGSILTVRDARALQLVKRGSNISVIFYQNNMAISFTAVALQSGVLGETIKVRKLNDKIIKIKIVGKNRGEVL